MTRIFATASALALSTGSALAHPSIQEHAHPHTDAASYFTVETLLIFAVGLSIGATLAWMKRRKDLDQ
ncbi:hypothetical protein [Roseibium alexandrii]|jgi:hypothetical protein|uniref:Secreted protein with PEP-CTERM sorting signal n=1 Tax=Roseibium alexandrii (strain DSM 17067 / NCIMB 14079 / DFL-11) TaxID=244592 RepID=A0A5E8H400_ROSAD|nr:hypothetical protein [Roseibium alexandrii]EEE46862.1 hypothetical protein SADFL11_4151 [Roseibium alexandrii DFL-11]